MRLYHFALLLCSTIAAAGSALLSGLARVADYMLALVPSGPSECFVGMAPAMPRAIGGTALPGSTLHSLRHEAGVSRYAAARNT